MSRIVWYNRILSAALIFLGSGCIFTPAYAFCFQPTFHETPPSLGLYASKPSVPWCLSDYSYTGKHTCDDWEIDSYFREVNEYISELNTLIAETNEFAERAIKFAEQTQSYAACEAEEVKKQHK